ncbi:RNA polymerase sigma factor [Ktedonosporobacter rubrisoli]|nr:sigma-70 family RNA polymerase sigma factor [Ktedonosporobacter rubrisoli]
MTKVLNKETSEAILRRFEWYITVQVKRQISCYPSLAHPSLLDLEIDEFVQRVRIKLWRMWERENILHPYSYIRRIVHSEWIDMLRQQKHTLPLSAAEDYEEWHYPEVKGYRREAVRDPADEIEQQMEARAFLDEVVRTVLALPPRQRQAMICSLYDKADDLAQLISAFKAHKTDIEAAYWPAEKAEKQLLQASLAAARKTLAKNLTCRWRDCCS